MRQRRSIYRQRASCVKFLLRWRNGTTVFPRQGHRQIHGPCVSSRELQPRNVQLLRKSRGGLPSFELRGFDQGPTAGPGGRWGTEREQAAALAPYDLRKTLRTLGRPATREGEIGFFNLIFKRNTKPTVDLDLDLENTNKTNTQRTQQQPRSTHPHPPIYYLFSYAGEKGGRPGSLGLDLLPSRAVLLALEELRVALLQLGLALRRHRLSLPLLLRQGAPHGHCQRSQSETITKHRAIHSASEPFSAKKEEKERKAKRNNK